MHPFSGKGMYRACMHTLRLITLIVLHFNSSACSGAPFDWEMYCSDLALQHKHICASILGSML